MDDSVDLRRPTAAFHVQIPLRGPSLRPTSPVHDFPTRGPFQTRRPSPISHLPSQVAQASSLSALCLDSSSDGTPRHHATMAVFLVSPALSRIASFYAEDFIEIGISQIVSFTRLRHRLHAPAHMIVAADLVGRCDYCSEHQPGPIRTLVIALLAPNFSGLRGVSI